MNAETNGRRREWAGRERRRLVLDHSRDETLVAVIRNPAGQRRVALLVGRDVPVIALDALDGRDAITESLIQVEQVIDDFALLSEATRNDAVRLGAVRSRMDALGRPRTLNAEMSGRRA